MALSLTAAALAATGQGGAVTRWIAELVDAPRARILERLPVPGRLLTVGSGAAALIDADGDRHGLGRFDDATWSPHGLYVAGAHGRQLSALDLHGGVRWTLSAPARVSHPRWGPDGYRIAYRAGRSLRVVAGDGSGDRLVAAATAAAAPAWRPDSSHALAYVSRTGGLFVAGADDGTRRRIGTAPRRTTWIGWSGRRRLLAAGPTAIVAYSASPRDHSGRASAANNPAATGTARLHDWRPPDGTAIAAATVAPGAHRVAVLLRSDRLSRLLLLDARTLRPERSLLTFRGTAAGLTWSPDGRWVGTVRPALGQWLLIPLTPAARPRALRGAGSPRGWCCDR
jgi:hypothetical protein